MTRIVLFLALLLPGVAYAGPWPAWRGPKGDGFTDDKNLPAEWSAKQNVVWKVKLPDKGNSSPIVWGDRVFITQAIEKENRRTLMCFDRQGGKLLWQEGAVYVEKEPTHSTNPYCSATPVTDGKIVVASFGSAGVSAYDFAGKKLWHRDLGEFIHIWGNAASPIIYGDLVILNCGPGERTFLLAMDRKTGADVWKVDEAGGKSGLKGGSWAGSWSTPVLAKFGGREQLIQSWPKTIKSYDPKTGDVLWSCSGLTDLVYSSPMVGDSFVAAMSGYHGSAIAVAPEGKGDITNKRLWRVDKKNPQRIGTGLVFGDTIYMVNEPGTLQGIDAKTGEIRWSERMGGQIWATLVAGDGKIYATTMAGETVVLAAKPEFEILHRNPLGERTLASPALSDGQIFIRTYQHLYCIGKK